MNMFPELLSKLYSFSEKNTEYNAKSGFNEQYS